MDARIITKVVAALQSSDDEQDALVAAFICLTAILQLPEAYTKQKWHPTYAFKKFVHWSLLAFDPIVARFSPRGQMALSNTFVVTREIDQKGQFILKSDEFSVASPDAEVINREFDVCISFAGEPSVATQNRPVVATAKPAT